MNKNENFIIFSDVKRVFIRFKWAICGGALLFGLIGFCVRSQLPVTYEVISTFKEAHSGSSVSGEGLFETMIKSIGVGGDQKGFFIITSSVMLRPVIEELGLQASIEMESWWKRKEQRVRDAIRAERKRPTSLKDRFIFENVHYQRECSEDYEVFFTSEESFEVRSLNSSLLATGRVGEAVQFKGVELTLKKTPSDLKLGHIYPLNLSSIHEHVLKLSGVIKVDTVKGERSLIKLTLAIEDREFGKKLLNTLMEVYKRYLIGENERVSQRQIGYLEERRKEFCIQMDTFLEEHVDYLKKSLGETGFLSLGSRLPPMQVRKKGLTEQLLELDSKYDALLGSNHSMFFESDTEMETLQSERRTLMRDRDELGLALMGETTPAPFIAKLDALSRREVGVRTGINQFFPRLNQSKRARDNILVSAPQWRTLLSPEGDQLGKIQREKRRVVALIKEKVHIDMTSSYLNNRLRLLSMREEIVKQRLFHHTRVGDDFMGMDIPTLKQLFLGYIHERDESLYKMRRLQFVKGQMGKEGIEWVSLSSTFPDGLSREMALEMGKLVQNMRKKRSFTEKEGARMERHFFEKKTNLIKHMDQTFHLQHLQTDLINERISLVQTAMLDLLNQEIALIEQQIRDRIADRLREVGREKEVVQGQIDDVIHEMERIPEVWLKERQLQFSSEMHKGMLESLVRLVESKNIESNLVGIESRPLDFANASLIPAPLNSSSSPFWESSLEWPSPLEGVLFGPSIGAFPSP